MDSMRWAPCAIALLAAVGGATTACSSDGIEGGATRSADVSTGRTRDDIAGEIGPGGGVMYEGHEFQSTPAELYGSQPGGETIVYDAVETDGYYVTAQRQGNHLCIRLRAAGKAEHPAAENCDVPAYAQPSDVGTKTTFLSTGTIRTEDGEALIAYGLTYRDATTITSDDGSDAATPKIGIPFWMHHFFALLVPQGDREVVLLDGEGTELGRVPLPS